MSRLTLTASAVALMAGALMPATPIHAQDRERELEMHRLHEACGHGDRKACVRFGIMIGESRERHAEWRRVHPEYFWWER